MSGYDALIQLNTRRWVCGRETYHSTSAIIFEDQVSAPFYNCQSNDIWGLCNIFILLTLEKSGFYTAEHYK